MYNKPASFLVFHTTLSLIILKTTVIVICEQWHMCFTHSRCKNLEFKVFLILPQYHAGQWVGKL
jgi:hypothetical protein